MGICSFTTVLLSYEGSVNRGGWFLLMFSAEDPGSVFSLFVGSSSTLGSMSSLDRLVGSHGWVAMGRGVINSVRRRFRLGESCGLLLLALFNGAGHGKTEAIRGFEAMDFT